MSEKEINKWLRRQFSLVGWVLIGYFVLMNILTTATMAVDAVGMAARAWISGDFDAMMDMSALTGNGWGYILSIAVGLFVLHAWKGRDYWKRELAQKEKSMTIGVFFAIVSLCIGAQLVNSLWVGLLEVTVNQFGHSLLPMLDSVSGSSDTFSMFLYMAVLAPISEEILFRGLVLRSLRPFGKRFAVLMSAFLFGIFHGNLLQTPFAFLVGLLLGYVAVEYSIFWAIALHGFNNLILGDLMTRLMNLLPEWTSYVIDGGIFGVFAMVSLALLITKRREIRAYRESEWMDRRCVKCFFTNSGIIVLTGLMVLLMGTLLFV